MTGNHGCRRHNSSVATLSASHIVLVPHVPELPGDGTAQCAEGCRGFLSGCGERLWCLLKAAAQREAHSEYFINTIFIHARVGRRRNKWDRQIKGPLADLARHYDCSHQSLLITGNETHVLFFIVWLFSLYYINLLSGYTTFSRVQILIDSTLLSTHKQNSCF